MNAPIDLQEHRQLALQQAALDAVGALSADEARGWFRDHLAADCAICNKAVATISELYEHLLLAAPPVEPPASIRERLLKAVRGTGSTDEAKSEAAPEDIQIWNRWTSSRPTELQTIPASDEEWQETAIPGIAIRSLHVDQERDLVTMLVRMQARTAYPRHRHAGDEQCYVLEGDLRVDDNTVLHAGDFQLAPADSVHGVQSTEGGCTLLITCSLDDERV